MSSSCDYPLDSCLLVFSDTFVWYHSFWCFALEALHIMSLYSTTYDVLYLFYLLIFIPNKLMWLLLWCTAEEHPYNYVFKRTSLTHHFNILFRQSFTVYSYKTSFQVNNTCQHSKTPPIKFWTLNILYQLTSHISQHASTHWRPAYLPHSPSPAHLSPGYNLTPHSHCQPWCLAVCSHCG